MRVVPFLNQSGEVVGEAKISEDGLTAEIQVTTDRATMCDLVGSDISIGYFVAQQVRKA